MTPLSSEVTRPVVESFVLKFNGIRHLVSGNVYIPYLDINGDETGFYRERLAIEGPDGQKYTQALGSGMHLYQPLGWHSRLIKNQEAILPKDAVVLTEGEFKALAFSSLGIPALGLGGIVACRPIKDDDDRVIGHEVLPELLAELKAAKIPRVYFLGDSDTCQNFQFAYQAFLLAECLAEHGVRVFLPRIPITGVDGPKGIDDVKEALERGAFLGFLARIFAEAIEVDPRADPPQSLALKLLEKEESALAKLLEGQACERITKRLVKLCAEATICRRTDRSATARLSERVGKLLGTEKAGLAREVESEIVRIKQGFGESLGSRDTLKGADEETDTEQELSPAQELPDLILPSGPVSFSDCAQKVFPVLARRHRFFVRDRVIVEIAFQKEIKGQPELHDIFQVLSSYAFRSRLEKDFTLGVLREKNGEYERKPGRCTNDVAKVLLESDAAFKYLPTISFLSAQPVYTAVEGKLTILYRGYHDVHGGIYVSNGSSKKLIVLPKVEEAVELILGIVKDYDFVSPSDKSRAVGSFITPALRAGRFLGEADIPIDIAEADKSQSGKTYRLKLVCALYGETPWLISNRQGGVGSLDESISSALLGGKPFIFFENFRGMLNSQLLETCLRGVGTAPARIPHRGEVQVPTAHINWQLSSNGLEATKDLGNRAVINRNVKREQGYKFAQYPEGDILKHIESNQPKYLAAVFAIIKEWFDLGRRRTGENRHDFSLWAQTLDWIVQEIFGLAPLFDGHVEEVLRVSDPALSWLRQAAIAVEEDRRLDEALSASQIVDICHSRGMTLPSKDLTDDLGHLSMYAGRLLGRLFRQDCLCVAIDRFKVEQETVKQTRRGGTGGDFYKHLYRFKRRL